MTVPTRKKINERLSVSVREHGYPFWTDIEIDGQGCVLNPEEAHDLLYAMQRICAFLDLKAEGHRSDVAAFNAHRHAQSQSK